MGRSCGPAATPSKRWVLWGAGRPPGAPCRAHPKPEPKSHRCEARRGLRHGALLMLCCATSRGRCPEAAAGSSPRPHRLRPANRLQPRALRDNTSPSQSLRGRYLRGRRKPWGAAPGVSHRRCTAAPPTRADGSSHSAAAAPCSPCGTACAAVAAAPPQCREHRGRPHAASCTCTLQLGKWQGSSAAAAAR